MVQELEDCRGGVRGGGTSGGVLTEELFQENWGSPIEENIPEFLEEIDDEAKVMT